MEQIIINGLKAKIADQWERVLASEEVVDRSVKNFYDQVNAHSALSMKILEKIPCVINYDLYNEYVYCVHEVAYANIGMLSAVEKNAIEQDKYNELVFALEEMHAYEDEEEDEDDDMEYEEVIFDEGDIPDCVVKERKTRRDILTPAEAIKANKASKMHKLKKRTDKVDKTKTNDTKLRTINRKKEVVIFAI